VISGNLRNGVHIDFDSANNTVDGNIIGLPVQGAGKIPNGGDGVFIEDSANNTTIGGGSFYDQNQNFVSLGM